MCQLYTVQPARSPDLNAIDFFLLELSKIACDKTLVHNFEELRLRIVESCEASSGNENRLPQNLFFTDGNKKE